MSNKNPWIIAVTLAGVVLLFAAVPADAWQKIPDIPKLTVDGVYGPFMPPDISQDGHHVDQLIDVVHWFMGVLFVGWGIFFVYCLVRFRQRSGHSASCDLPKAKPAKISEILVVIFEAVLLLGFSIPIWAQARDQPPEDENTLTIRVVAEQFQWNFHYPGEDGIFGPTSPDAIDYSENNAVGVVRDSEYGADDIVTGEMHIPNDRPIICEISSKDVIHSFSINVMRVKQDAIPGMRIPVWFRVKIPEDGSDATTGRYEVACAQLCGSNHYSMKAYMVVETPEDYAAWLVEKSAPPEEFDEDE